MMKNRRGTIEDERKVTRIMATTDFGHGRFTNDDYYYYYCINNGLQ